jgi:hypothetical protein
MLNLSKLSIQFVIPNGFINAKDVELTLNSYLLLKVAKNVCRIIIKLINR